MTNLRKWITGTRKAGAATFATSATGAQKPQKTAPLQVAAKLLPDCYLKRGQGVQVATGSNPLATRRPAENCEKSPQVAGSRVAGSENEKDQLIPALCVAPDLNDRDDLLAFLHEQASRHMAYDVPEAEADCLAFDRLLWIWCEGNPQNHPRGLCAACGKPFNPEPLDLPDGARVCLRDDHACLIAYGTRCRRQAVEI